MISLLLLFITNTARASPMPCSEFEVYIKSGEVREYTKKDGTQVSEAFRKAHCREIYPETKNWAQNFKDTSLELWPYNETFKPWNRKEKEIILQMISTWPDRFKGRKDISIYRAKKSNFPHNPGASLPSANAIIIYDDFFHFPKAHAVLSHELAHIFILSLPSDKLNQILSATGWERDLTNRPKWSGKNKPLKEDSIDSPSEDLANHIEEFLHSPKTLKINRPDIFKLFENLLGSDFHLKDQK